MIILIGCKKGGTGKSTIAENLAVIIAHKKENVLLLDADPQGTATDWVNERNKATDLIKIHSVQKRGNLTSALEDLKGRYDNIIIDAGGFDSEALRSAMVCADVMLIPFRPKRRDLKQLDKMAQLVSMAKSINKNLVVRAIITQCPTLPSQYYRIEDARQACASFGLTPLQSKTFFRNAYDDCDEGGQSVIECSDEKAKAEMQAVAEELFSTQDNNDIV